MSQARPGKIKLLIKGIRAVEVLLLAALVTACIPLTIPRLFGYHAYSVISGSMEPAIPVGSLVYVKEARPEAIEEGDVIAFYAIRDSGSIITHRVVENRSETREFITKGDANAAEDMTPIPYSHFVGKVTGSIPGIGRAAELFTGPGGRKASLGLLLTAVLLHILASALAWEPGPGKNKKKEHHGGNGT